MAEPTVDARQAAAAALPQPTILQFTPFTSSLLPEFWTSLSKLKIDKLKLDESPIPVRGSYSGGRSIVDRETGQQVGLGCMCNIDGDALDDEQQQGREPSRESQRNSNRNSIVMDGTLINYNTIEAFKQADKQSLFQDVSRRLWDKITSSDQRLAANDINTLFLITFADLKKYTFLYWFAFPTFIAKPAWTLEAPWAKLDEAFEKPQAETILASYREHCNTAEVRDTAACLLKRSLNDSERYEAASLADFASFHGDTRTSQEPPTVVFLDPSSDSHAVGWPLRNILASLYVRHRITRLRIVAIRGNPSESITSIVSLPDTTIAYDETRPASVGWEKNAAGKLGPRLSDLGAMMDPKRLADQAVDLNLKLMRWRILPALDLEKIKNTRCLLLGAGTLGCYVSRTLMAWGVRKITLVDSGKVSYSNPVRQPLFEFSDCLEGGKPKAECAAEALKRIYPSVDATGIHLSIPMPGHPVPPNLVHQTESSVQTLQELFDQHDAVYLLMDSRESRWLPTLLGAAKRKLVMNAALGFDTYLVMRHGLIDQPIEERLGCYYCNDIVAPLDSLSDRTLDQMCTVTRPGLAAIASATAVELMTSTLQHPKGMGAPSEFDNNNVANTSVLGSVPHQIRGFLSQFNQLKITGRAYTNCTACSEKVVDAYKREGFAMLRKAFDDAKYLEQITGLDKLQQETEAAMEAVDWEEDGTDEDF